MDTRTAESGLIMGDLMARALRDSEARLRSVINSAPLVLWTLDREGIFTSSEGKGLESLGLRPGEVVGRSVFEVYREYPQLLEEIQRALAGEEVTTEVEVGGSVFETRYSPLHNDEGDLAGAIGVAVDVSERREAEEELRRSEERTREILESAHDAFIAMDTQGRVCGWNSQAEATFGWPREEALGRLLTELIIPPRYREAHQQGLARFLATGEGPVLGRRIEVTGLHRDGTELPVEMTISAIRQGESYLFSAFLHDITERKRAEAALQRRAEQAQRFQEALLELARASDADLDSALQRITRVDADALGVERVSVWFFDGGGSELRCRVLFTRPDGAYSGGTALHAAELPDYFRALRDRRVVAAHNAIADAATHEFADEYLRPLGITSMLDVPVWRRGSMVGVVCHEHVGPRREWTIEEQDFAASIADMVSLALEASERAQAEQAARETEARKASIVEASLDCIVVMDASGRILEFNPAAERVFGYRAAEAIGRDVAELIVPERLREPHRRGIRRYLATGQSNYLDRTIETTAMRSDGAEFPVELTVMRIPSQGESLFTGVVRDITERKHAEEALRTTQREAETMAGRMRAVATAAAGVIGATSRPALREVLEQACRQVLSFDAFFIMAYDARSHSFLGFGGTDAGVYSEPNLVPAAGTPGERVIQTRRTIVTRSADDPAASGAQLTGTGRRSESTIRTPILSGEEMLGILVVQSYTPGLYSAEDIEVLEAVASLAATALANIRLLEEQQEAQEALRASERRAQAMAERMRAVASAAAGVIGAESLDALQDVLQSACRMVISFDAFAFALYDPQAHTFSFLPGYDAGVFVPEDTISARGVPMERVVRERRSLVTLRSNDPEAAGSIPMGTGRRSESVIRTPILSGNRVLAVLSVQSYTPDLYTEEDVQVLEAVASLAANALENIRLESEQRAAEEALRVSETRFRTIFEQFPLSLQIFSPTGKTLEVNRSWQELFGMTPEQLGSFNPLHDPQLAELSDYMRRGFGGETLLVPPSLFDPAPIGNGVTPEGAEGERAGPRWIQAFICPVKENGGEVREVFMIHQDVTAQKEAEQVLRRSHEELEQLVTARTAELAHTNQVLEAEIAERERAEEELRTKSSELEAVFQALPDLYFRLDTEGRFLDFRAGQSSSLFAAPEEFLGQRMQDVLPPQVAQGLAEGLDQLNQTGELVCIEYSLPYPDGNRDFEARLLPFTEGQVVTVVRDITEQKEAERALQRSEEHFRRITENSSDVASILDARGIGVYHSPSAERVLGYPVEEILGTSSFDRIHPEDHQKCRETLGAMFKAPGTDRTVEFRYLNGRKGWRVLEVIGRTLLPDTAEAGVIINARDVTERKEAEEALRHSEERFRALIENGSDLITVVDASGVIEYQSPSVTRVLGYDPETLLGRDARELAHPEDTAGMTQIMEAALREPGTAHSVEFRFRHADGAWRVFEGIGRTLLADSATEELVINSRDITERKRSEEQLHLQKTLLEAQGEASIDGILVVSPEGKMLSFNRRFAEMWGIPEEVIETRSDQAAVQAVLDQLEDPQEFTARIGYLYEHRDEESRDEVLLRDGRIFDRYSAPVTSREGGDYYGRIWFFRDITDRKQAEQALRASEESYRGLFDTLTELVYVQDLEGRFVNVNEAVLRSYGYTREEIIGQDPELFADPERVDVADTMKRFCKAVEGEPQRFEWWGRRKDGSIFPKEVVLTRSTYFGQDVVIAVARDVTDRSLAEQALRESEQRFRAVVENASDLVTLMDGTGVVRYQSPAIERTYGYTQEELIGRNCFELVHPDDVPQVVPKLAELATHPGETRSAGFRFRHKDGRWIHVEAVGATLSPTDPDEGVVVNTRDITERKETMEALERAKQEAEEANRAKSEFLSRMSHELRTPMNSILGFAQLLQRKPLPSDEHKRVEHILKAGRHLLNLINEVLDIARIEAGRQNFSLEPVQVATVVQEALSLIRPLAAEWGCRIEECCPFPELFVRADRQRLTQVLLNLLSNAIKYNHRGGSVCVRWEMKEARAGEGAARLRIGVQDTGPGIAPEKQAQLFVPFERLGAEQSGIEGTGLGLALSKRLVEAMGGSLTVESVVGEGSTFWVEFAHEPSPLERLAASGGVKMGAVEAATEAPAATVLYVEDNLANLALIESILESRPEITLVTALQGQMGLELAAQHHPDLILLDLHLPDLRGDEVFKRLQSDPRTRGIPVVVITADAMPGRIKQLMQEGVRAYLTKPLDVDEFLDTIDGILAEREER